MSSQLQVFNTLSGKKEIFQPISGNTVRIYACGPTVYDLSHIGHARMAIVWDVIPRYLRYLGYDVIFVRNITDVDDKIIKRAPLLGMRPEQVSREFTFAFWRDMRALNVQQPDFEPRATEYISQMFSFIDSLIKAGHAYPAGGDVYFDVASFKNYGQLKKQNLEDMKSGTRELAVSQEELSESKKNAADFALWKGAKEGELGWQSPWGYGRPGWHLECSTMIKSVLGETIDIHGAGEDLVFPHNENEKAQSEALHEKPLARYWLHNAMVNVDSEKMSKSLGNFKTIQDLLQSYSPDTIRLFILQTHYRTPLEFSAEAIEAVKSGISRLVRAASISPPENNGQAVELPEAKELEEQFRAAMDNDFNTAAAVALLYGIADKVFQEKDARRQAELVKLLRKYASVLGLTLEDNSKALESQTAGKLIDLILTLRQDARTRKDFKTSDLIRDELASVGIKVMDTTGGGATWEQV